MEWKKNLAVLALGMVFASVSYTMVIPFLPLFLLELGATEESVALWSGLVFSSTFLVAAVMGPVWGKRADRYGKKKMVLRAGYCLAVVYILGALVENPYHLLGMRILQGFANGFVPAALAIIATNVPKEKLGFSMGLMQGGLLVGTIVGPLFGGVLSDLFGMRMSFVIAGLVIGVITVLVTFVVKDNSKQEQKTVTSMKEDMRIALTNRRVRDMLILLFMLQMGGLMLQPIITLCVDALNPTGDAFGGTVIASGLVFSLIGISGAVSAPLWGRYGQKFGYYRVLVVAFAGAGIVHIVQSRSDSLTMFCMMQAIIGLFIVGVQPALNAIMVNSTNADFHGRVFGIATTFNQLGCMAGPLVGGVLSGIVGNMAVFACVGLMHIVTAMVVFCRERGQILEGK